MPTCYHCGNDADFWNKEDEPVCSDCWIAPPDGDDFARFIRETTDATSGKNKSDET